MQAPIMRLKVRGRPRHPQCLKLASDSRNLTVVEEGPVASRIVVRTLVIFSPKAAELLSLPHASSDESAAGKVQSVFVSVLEYLNANQKQR
jgi:hypothetical protein